MRKFKKQVTAILLGIAIAVTQPGWGNIGVLPPISAEAAETGNNLFIDGDLGDDADDDLWTNPVWKFEDDGTGVLGQNAINYNKWSWYLLYKFWSSKYVPGNCFFRARKLYS